MLLFYLPAEYVNAKPPPQPERYIVPCIPFLALALGAFLSAIYGYSRRHFGRAGEILIGIIFITAFALPLEYSWSHGASIKHDTRDEAAEWIKKNTSHHASFLIDWKFYGPAQLEKSHTVMDFKDKRGAKILRGISVESLSETPFDYLVISSLFYGRYLDPLYRTHNLSKRIRKLFEELPPAAYFSRPRYNYGFHNPDIYIFAIPKTGLPHEK